MTLPPQLLGIPGDSTFSNYEQAKLAFWTDTVLPLLGMVQDGFNRWLTPLYGEDIILWYDEETVPALEPLRKAKFERLKLADWMTVNEKRRASGEDDIEGGDVVFVPFNSIPLNLAGDSVHIAPGNDLPTDAKPADAQPTADPATAAKRKQWLIANGYTPERAERLTKLAYE